MRYLSFAVALSLWTAALPAIAGQIVLTGKYAPHTVVQGFGLSQAEAISDATAVVPGGYFLDQDNDWDIVAQGSGRWMATRPLKHECADESCN